MCDKQATYTMATQALVDWAKANGITPVIFHKTTGFTYQHAWRLLSGQAGVTERTLGRLLLTYPEAARRVAAAMRDDFGRVPA